MLATSYVPDTIKALLAYPDHERLSRYTPIVPTKRAQGVLDFFESRSELCVPQVSHSYMAQLMGCYPSRDMADAQTYTAALTALFCAYPENFVKRVCNPVTGLPSRSKWFPTIAEVKEALEAEKAKRDTIIANARWTLQEAGRRAREAQDEAKYKPGTSEDRAATVARYLKARAM